MQGFLLFSFNIHITPLIDSNQDGILVRRSTFTFETDPAFNLEIILR